MSNVFPGTGPMPAPTGGAQPLVSSQDRWAQFFAQQGREMPQIQRPQLPPMAAPQAQQAGQRTPLLDRLRSTPNAPNGYFANMLWKAANAQPQGQQPQQAQQGLARMQQPIPQQQMGAPRLGQGGFFRSRLGG